MNEKFLLAIKQKSQKIGIAIFLILSLLGIIIAHASINTHRYNIPKQSTFLEFEKKSSEKYLRFLFPKDDYPWFVSWSGPAIFSSVGLQQSQTTEQLCEQSHTTDAPFISSISLSFKFITVFLFNDNFLPSNFFILPPVDLHYTTFRGNYNIGKKKRFVHGWQIEKIYKT